jgi:signal transduction histidine kinase
VLQGNLAELREEAIQKAGGSLVASTSLTQAIEDAAYLGALVHNLGAAAKLDSGPAHASVHPLDLCALVERVVARHRPVAEPRGVGLDYAVPETAVFIDADVTLIEQAIGNLVLNAIRHNAPNGHAAVVLKASEADGTFSLLVTDDGPGVSDEDLAHLGERGWRGPAGDRHVDGRGLGLHIARSVAERHHMSLQFRTSEYGGLEAELKGRIRSDREAPHDGAAADDSSATRGQP